MTGRHTGRIETLACELAAGKSVEQAMLAAGYAAKTAQQGRIRHGERLVSPHNHPNVAARMGEIQAAAREDSRLDIGDIVAGLQEAIDIAKADRRPSAMIQGRMGQAKVLGLIVDRKMIGIRALPLERLNEAELAILAGEDAEGAD